MKKIISPYNKTFEYIKIYRNEIEEIIQQIEKKTSIITISVNDFVLDDLDELTKLKTSHADQLFISTEYPGIKLHFSKSSIWIYSDTVNPEYEATLIIIENIINRCESHIWKFVGKYSYKIILILFILFFPFLIFLYKKGLINKSFLNYYQLVNLINIALFLVISKIPKNKINLYYRHEIKPFFIRNIDEILINLIFLVIGILIGKIEEVIQFFKNLF